MNDRVRELLLHLETAAEDAISFTAGTTQSDFADDKRTQQAVIMSLVIVGEVSSKLIATAPDFVAAHPEIPWRSMRGMRNRVIHGYFQTDLMLVWDTVQHALPELLKSLQRLQENVQSSGNP